MPEHKIRIYEIPEPKFHVLLRHMHLTDDMRKALRIRYDSMNSYSRNSVTLQTSVSEVGLMKAEKRVIKAHQEFSEVYSG